MWIRALTKIIHRRRTDLATAALGSNPGDPNLQGHAALAVVLPKGDSHPAARTVTTHVMDALTHIALVRRYPVPRCPAATYPLGRLLRQPVPVSFCGKRRALLTLLQP
jgi:hypothetical protein